MTITVHSGCVGPEFILNVYQNRSVDEPCSTSLVESPKLSGVVSTKSPIKLKCIDVGSECAVIYFSGVLGIHRRKRREVLVASMKFIPGKKVRER